MSEKADQHLICPKCGHYSNKIFVTFFHQRKPLDEAYRLAEGLQQELTPLNPYEQKPVYCPCNNPNCPHCNGN